MSEFVFIVPPDWVQISQEMIDLIGANIIRDWVDRGDFYSLGQAMRENGYPDSISEAIFFNSEILAVR